MEKIYQLWWHSVGIDSKIKKNLLDQMKSCKEIYNKNKDFYKLFSVSEKCRDLIEASKQNLNYYEEVLKQCEKQFIDLVWIEDEEYPALLKEIDNPPLMLFIKGNKECLKTPMMAIVGSRKCSEYGFEVAKNLGKELSRIGMCVVSGMARGIDEGAHKGAVQVGESIAVLGTGVDICYPIQNNDIYSEIQEKGCLMSEFFPGTKGLPYHFPMRNRIISGLSIGTIVVEAAEKSGSLITSHLALEQNREVFAVPGNIFSVFSKGTNKLIQAGAKLVMNLEDILSEIPESYRKNLSDLRDNSVNNKTILLDKVEIMVYDCLSWQPIQIESIEKEVLSNKINLSLQMLEMILLKLEVKGLVQRLPGRRYSRMK